MPQSSISPIFRTLNRQGAKNAKEKRGERGLHLRAMGDGIVDIQDGPFAGSGWTDSGFPFGELEAPPTFRCIVFRCSHLDS